MLASYSGSFYMPTSCSGYMVLMSWCFILLLFVISLLVILSALSYAVCWWAGRFLGELTKQVFSDLVASKYQVLHFPICRWVLYIDVDSGIFILLYIFQWYLNLWYCICFVKCLKAVHFKIIWLKTVNICCLQQLRNASDTKFVLRPCFFVVFLHLLILFSFSRLYLNRKIWNSWML